MFENLQVLRMAQSMAAHAAARHNVVSANIANADTPGYRQRDIASFAEIWNDTAGGDALRQTRAAHLQTSPATTEQRPFVVGHATADPNGNTVSLEVEIMKSAEIKQQHDLALSIYRSGLSVLRSSLGRG